MGRDYSKYDPTYDSSIVMNHRQLIKETLGLILDNVTDEEIYKIYMNNTPFETPDIDEYLFLEEVAKNYGDPEHPWFSENVPEGLREKKE